MLGGVKSMYTLAKCRKHITGASPPPLLRAFLICFRQCNYVLRHHTYLWLRRSFVAACMILDASASNTNITFAQLCQRSPALAYTFVHSCVVRSQPRIGCTEMRARSSGEPTVAGMCSRLSHVTLEWFAPAGFSLPGFKAEALRLYEDVCQAVADDDKNVLRQV